PLLPRSIRPPTSATLFPYTTLIRSFRPDAGGLPLEVLDGLVDVVGQVQPIDVGLLDHPAGEHGAAQPVQQRGPVVDADEHDGETDRKSTRLNSSHVSISYAVFCLRK